jgi:hypothetical protein
MSLYSAANSAAFDRAQEAWDNATPPEYTPGPCRECPDSMEDHDWDAEDGAWVCQVKGCECDDGSEYTLDDHLADEADRYYDDYKAGGF